MSLHEKVRKHKRKLAAGGMMALVALQGCGKSSQESLLEQRGLTADVDNAQEIDHNLVASAKDMGISFKDTPKGQVVELRWQNNGRVVTSDLPDTKVVLDPSDHPEGSAQVSFWFNPHGQGASVKSGDRSINDYFNDPNFEQAIVRNITSRQIDGLEQRKILDEKGISGRHPLVVLTKEQNAIVQQGNLNGKLNGDFIAIVGAVSGEVSGTSKSDVQRTAVIAWQSNAPDKGISVSYIDPKMIRIVPVDDPNQKPEVEFDFNIPNLLKSGQCVQLTFADAWNGSARKCASEADFPKANDFITGNRIDQVVVFMSKDQAKKAATTLTAQG